MTLANPEFASYVLRLSNMDKEELRLMAHHQFIESQESHRSIQSLRRKVRKMEVASRSDSYVPEQE